MVQIVREMGSGASGRYSHVELEDIPAEYVEHYIIQEYDGRESLVIQYDAYKVDTAKSILKDQTITLKQRLARVSAVLNAELAGGCTEEYGNVRSVAYPQ
jgi:multidrug efflux pump subunit AcrB